jgi:hypothetical protein
MKTGNGAAEKLLNPATLKQNLILSSLFLSAYETLRAAIIDQLQGFFVNGFDSNGLTICETYKSKVLSRDKSPLKASILWFREMDAIDDADIAAVDQIREHRNEIAHDLPKYIANEGEELDLSLLAEIARLVAKIDQWWFREIEASTNPDLIDEANGEIDYGAVMSGRMIFLKILVDVATGDDDESSAYYNAYQELNRSQQPAEPSDARKSPVGREFES